MSDLEEGISSFSSVEEELEYWKRKSLEYCERSIFIPLCVYYLWCNSIVYQVTRCR